MIKFTRSIKASCASKSKKYFEMNNLNNCDLCLFKDNVSPRFPNFKIRVLTCYILM